MKQKPEQPAFRMPVEDLLVLADTKIAFARRPDDATALAGRGWSETRIDALADAFAAVSKLPTDTELEQEVRAAEQKKNEHRAATTTLIQTALSKVNQVHHDESPEYRAFGSAKLYNAGDSAFALLCEQVSRVGQRMLVDDPEEDQAAYEATGLTPAEFITIGAAGDEFRRLLIDIRIAEAKRDHGTQQRLRLANPAYRDLAALCETGKALYIASDEARYNDYLVYDAAEAPATPKPKDAPAPDAPGAAPYGALGAPMNPAAPIGLENPLGGAPTPSPGPPQG